MNPPSSEPMGIVPQTRQRIVALTRPRSSASREQSAQETSETAEAEYHADHRRRKRERLGHVQEVNGQLPVMGFLAAAEKLPFLLVGLLAGVLVDRLRYRSLLVAADLGRAILLGSIPVAAIFGVLRRGDDAKAGAAG